MGYEKIVEEVMENLTLEKNQEKVPVILADVSQKFNDAVIERITNADCPVGIIECDSLLLVGGLYDSVRSMITMPNPIIVLSGINEADPQIRAAIINMCKRRTIDGPRAFTVSDISHMKFIITTFGGDTDGLTGDGFVVYPEAPTS